MRQRLAQEAAQIMIDSGRRDFFAAKRKAAEHLGASDTRNMPSNLEIEEAMKAYQRIFRADSQPRILQHLREVALQAMKFFSRYKPRLVGSVLRGTADTHSVITLHLFADTSEEIDLFLLDNAIPFEEGEKKLRFGTDHYVNLPMFRFVAEDVPVELVVFTHNAPHQSPVSPVDGHGMRRADIRELQQLLDSPAADPGSP